MTQIVDLISRLRHQGIRVGHAGDQLRLSGDLHRLTGADKAELQHHKPALLAFVREELRKRETAGEGAIPAIPAGRDYPVSEGQQRLWLVHQQDRHSTAYHIPGRADLPGPHSAAYFERAIQQVIDRHEILRTVFRENEDGELRQVVLPPDQARFRLTSHRVEDLPGADADGYVAAQSGRPFDLGAWPLLRAGLIQRPDGGCTFYYTLHHIIGDGWSLEILYRDVLTGYRALERGAPAGLSPLRIHYKDYVAWQQPQLAEAALAGHRQYWLDRLAGPLPVLALGEKSRPAVKTNGGRFAFFSLDGPQAAQLARLARERQGTLFMSTLALCKALFYCYTHQHDVIMGCTLAGRDHPDLEDQIGFYLKVLPLRTVFKETDTFAALLDRVVTGTTQDMLHQAYPLGRLVAELNVPRDRSRSPVFDVLINFQNLSLGAPAVPDHAPGGAPAPPETEAKYDLSFYVKPHGAGLDFHLLYRPDLFTETFMEGFGRNYQLLARHVLNDPGLTLRQLRDLLQPAPARAEREAFRLSLLAPLEEDF